MRLPCILGLFALLAASIAPGPAEDPPTVELKLSGKTAPSGGVLKGKVIVTFAPGWHGYQNPPKNDYEIPLKVDSAAKDLKVKVSYPKGVLKEFQGSKSLMYEGVVEIPVVVYLPKKIGPYTVKLDVSYQQCDDSTCLPPGKLSLSEKVTLKKSAPVKPVKKP
jgi:DsbC/DsbD-like thiol-disulfide interchange protein